MTRKNAEGRRLVKVAQVAKAAQILWDLMHEVELHQAISHVTMPTWEEHLSFVQRYPFRIWYLIEAEGIFVGYISLSRHNEIGLRLFREHQRKGHGSWAVRELIRMWAGDLAKPRAGLQRGGFLANINPANEASLKLFASLGFKHVQNTYALDACELPSSSPS